MIAAAALAVDPAAPAGDATGGEDAGAGSGAGDGGAAQPATSTGTTIRGRMSRRPIMLVAVDRVVEVMTYGSLS